MKSQLFSQRSWGVIALACLLGFAVADTQAKLIRLRNETISTKPTTEAIAPAGLTQVQTPVSGLYLIQFKAPPGPIERARLAVAGVDLLHYVPDDAFVARMRGARLRELGALPFVQWIGAYRPEHKLHKSLAAAATQSKSELIGVTLLLIPRASAAEIAAVRSMLAVVQQESTLRAGTILRGRINATQISSLARSDSILWMEPAHDMKLVDEVASKIVAGDGGPQTLLAQSLGYDGQGVNVAVADSGLNNGDAATMHPDLLGRTPTFFYYGTLTDAADEHSHGTHVAGIVAGNGATGEVDPDGALYGLGVAPGASIIAQRIFDGVGNYEAPPSYEKLTRDATRAGAVIGSNSWGDDTQGRYDVSAMEFDELVRDADALALGDQPYILEFSAGNAGPGDQTIGSPAVAKNVIATGASENDRTDLLIYADGPDAMADFSSRGPCEDGRIKPDLVAPGTWIASLQSQSATDQYAWAPISPNYQYQGGTSQAGPHASGAAAVFVQFYRQSHTNATPSPALVKAALINSATELGDAGPGPTMDAGWGRIDLTPFFDPSISFRFYEQNQVLTNGQVYDQRVVIASREQVFRVTLAYTDPPGLPATIPALVNDLNLEVLAPDGRLYRGNQFDNGESIPNAAATDTINNVEGVQLSTPVPGEYVIRVRGAHIVEDIHGGTNLVGQDFALVVSGDIPAAGVGSVILDRGAYRAPDRVQITLVDTDLAGKPATNVVVTSTTEITGETLVLTAASASGTFTGSIATATGPAVADGRLQVAHNDNIQVTYFDASSGFTRISTARADLVPPVITGVQATNAFGLADISWNTDEPATSIVRYGTNASLSGLTFAVTNSDLVTSHQIALDSLVANRTYYYYVVSADEAGNLSTNNHNNTLFSFVAAATATVMLVDEYTDPYFGVPPLSGYTDPLSQAGISYDVWDVSQRGSPSLGTLKAYKALIWRVPELSGTWSASERLAISNYLHSGGALLVASMEVLSRLEEANATNFTHDVLQIQSYIVDPNSTGAAEVIGSPYESIGSGLDIVTDFTPYDNIWGGFLGPDLSDTITPRPGATSMLRNDAGDVVGLRWPAIGQQAPGRLVFLSFPLDALPMNGGVDDRVALLRNIVSFLVPGASGLGTVDLDSPAYTLPSMVTVEVGDSSIAGQGSVSVAAFSTSQTNSIPVTLQETVKQGVFIGSFQVTTKTNHPSDRIHAKNGDQITVDYYDASAHTHVRASAVVDTVPATIANVVADPDYEDATVSWTTSKPADSLVEFGESMLLGRSAYDANLDSSHAVTLHGLVPNHLYFYRVTSRDVAGNTVMDDNHGSLYKFQTPLPIIAPWFDKLNTGATNWSVFSADMSQSVWTLGVPSNGRQTSAYSPPALFGSDLNGAAIDYTETYLISPAIYLTNGNVATLSFWHDYDISDLTGYDILAAEVQIITNNATAAVAVADFTDASVGWEHPQIDLTPFMGHIIYVVYYYLVFSVDSLPRPGWLVDDVSITISNVQPGTIQITNNLWQTTYVLSGPMYMKARGLGTFITNAPPGKYIVEYADIPYYQTPAPQTNNLISGANALFQGNYTFTDANANGISDEWEMRFFGNVSPYRTRSTDTDGDGLSDYAEFIAGTDPNNPPRRFSLTAQRVSNTVCRLQWNSAAGQQYRVQSSSNLVTWAPYSTWQAATGSTARVDVPITAASKQSFFKVQAWTTNSPAGLAPDFHVTAQRLPNGTISLQWTSSADRGYQVLGSTDGVSWSPVSAWVQATTTSTSYTLPAQTPGGPRLFRVQVRP